MFIYKKTQLVGYLNFCKGQYRFIYANEYLCQKEIIPLSPDLPLSSKVLLSEKLFPVFEQVIPEGQTRKWLKKKANSKNNFDLLPLLHDIYGDLQFSKHQISFPKDSAYKLHYPEVKTEILGEHAFPNIINRTIRIEDEKLFPLFNGPSSTLYPLGLSGLQNKLSVIVTSRSIRYRQKNEESHYLLKPYRLSNAEPFNEVYMPHLAINEHLFMTFAKNELGFDVPWNAIVKRPTDKEYHFLVKRYDRHQGYRFTFNEFAVFLDLSSKDKHNVTVEQLFRNIKKHLTLKGERLILLKYSFYSMLIANGNMHVKNLAMLTEGNRRWMAPLCGIVATGVYPKIEHEIASPIGNKFKDIGVERFYKLVHSLEVTERKFAVAAADILFKYTHILPDYFTRLESLPDIIFHERTWGRKSQIVRSIPFVEQLRMQHKERIKQLEEMGWYERLHVPVWKNK